jgi:hypothetical protein
MKRITLFVVALFCVSVFAQDLPRIGVYVTGNVGEDEKKALGTRMLASLVNSGRYKGIERSNSFLTEIEKEQEKQRSGNIDDNQISALGKQFGVKFVCIADITPAYGSFQVSARIVNVETAEVEFIGESSSPLKTMDDLAQVSNEVVKNMFGSQTMTAPEPKSEPMLVPIPEPIKQAAPTAPLAADEKVTFEEVFFPSKKGMLLTYDTFDKAGKRFVNKLGYRRIKVKYVTGTADNGTIVYSHYHFNKTTEYTANVVGGVLKLPAMALAFHKKAKVMVTEDTRTLLPSKLTIGDILPDVKYTITVTLGNTVDITETITDRKCTGIEKVTVPAGTFECYKVEQKTTNVANFVTKIYNGTIWYARGIGVVKIIVYDLDGNPQGSEELQKLVRK